MHKHEHHCINWDPSEEIKSDRYGGVGAGRSDKRAWIGFATLNSLENISPILWNYRLGAAGEADAVRLRRGNLQAGSMPSGACACCLLKLCSSTPYTADSPYIRNCVDEWFSLQFWTLETILLKYKFSTVEMKIESFVLSYRKKIY